MNRMTTGWQLDVDKEYTAGGNMRAPARRILVAWVLKAWNKLDMERVKNSLKVCVCVCVCVHAFVSACVRARVSLCVCFQMAAVDSSKTVVLAALGRPFSLGMLYDCRNDSLIPGKYNITEYRV